LWPRDDGLFNPPHILIKEHESLPVVLRKTGGKLLFRDQIVGIAAPAKDISRLESLYEFLKANRKFVEFFAAFGAKYLIGRQAALLKKNIMDLPSPEGGEIVFRGVRKYLLDDVINFMIPLVKDTDAEGQELAAQAKEMEVKVYAKVFGELMQSVYPDLRLEGAHDLDTGWCVAFHKGKGAGSTFGDTESLRKHIDALLSRETGRALRTWRIVRHFSGNDLFIIKPKPRRYWLRSAAVTDADQIFAWLTRRLARGNEKNFRRALTI
jgi:hypothetical protein